MADKTYLNWPFFEDSHREFASTFADWTAAEIEPMVGDEPQTDAEIDTLSKALVAKFGEGGWLRHCVPAAYGGISEKLDVRTICLARDTLAQIDGLAEFCFAMQGLGSIAVTLFGSDEQKQHLLPRVASGEATAAFAISEKIAGSDAGALTMTAERDGDEFVLNGEKTWISNAGIADSYVVFARTGEQPGARGLSAFLVDADTPGFAVSERISVIAPHPLGTLNFDNVRIPSSRLIGDAGSGFKVAMSSLDVFRSTVGAAALGMARRALDEATARAKTREAFGSPISEFQLIQAKIADMAVAIDATALLVYRAAWTKDAGAARVTREASMAKMYATEAAQIVIDQAVQIFGGMGVVSGVPVERLYREIRALRIYEGTTEIQKLVIASQVLNES